MNVTVNTIDRMDGHSVDTAEKVGQKYDHGKSMMGWIPPREEMAVADVLTFGASKYSANNWSHVGDLERHQKQL